MTQIASSPSLPPILRPVSKRQAILDAAKRAFLRDGVSGVSIDAIAMDAGVSRQTVYNQLGDKDQLLFAVVEDVTARSSALLMGVLASFPDKPDNLHQALTDFAIRLSSRCTCDIDGRTLLRLLEREAKRYPELLAAWSEYGPGKDWPMISDRFAKLAQDGYIDIDDAGLTARHFIALINADLPRDQGTCIMPSEESIRDAATKGVSTFLRAFGRRN